MDIVDTHPHVVADDLEKYPLSPIGGNLSAYAKHHRVSTEEYLKYLDQAEVAQAVLVQSSTGHGYDNSYCADSAARYPNRFVGVCCVDAPAPDAAEKLRYWIRERGMDGVRLFTTGTTVGETDWLDKPVTYPFFDEAERLGVSVCIQIRRSGIPMLANVLKRYPNVPIVMDHMATPLPEGDYPYLEPQELLDLAQFQNLYLKITTGNLRDAAKIPSTVEGFYGMLIKHFGAKRMMWGSNLPSVWGTGPNGPYKELVDLARGSFGFASEEDQRWILAETARTVYPGLRRAS